MKKLFASVCAALTFISTVVAGTATVSSSKDMTKPPCPGWYADREWNLSLWSAYAFPTNDYPTLRNSNPNFGSPDHDNYLEADHAWGGGIDAKYFFARYFGVGVEGYALDVRQSYGNVFIPFFGLGNNGIAETAHERNAIGAVLGTFTLRYPIGCSRFAPYVFAGGGAILGGGQTTTISITALPDGVVTFRSDSKTKAVGQFGGGFEVRLTPHIGLINDFTWNVVDGSKNNFGMARTGVNFAF
jgi:hypothetical protein